jgi:Domain of unknown function (DUF4349)
VSAPRRALPFVAIALVAALAVACEKGDRAAGDTAGAASLLMAEQSTPRAITADAPSGLGPPMRVAAPQSRTAGRGGVGSAFGTGSGSGTGGGGGGGVGGVGEGGGTTAAVEITQLNPQPGSRAATETTSVASTAMLIRTGSATVEVDSLERAIAAVQEMARRLGGYVANTNLMVGDRQPRRADLELRFPSSRFDDATGALRPLGKVESLVVNTEDVGEEFVDMTARMSNARRLEERLIDLLARRTGKLEDMLSVERELARVREEIERYEGRLRYLRSRTALSTLSVTVHEPAPVFEPRPGPSRIGEAFREAWRNFVGFLAAFISSLGWLVPLVAIAGAVVWAGRRWLPRPSAPAPTPAPRPTPMPEKRDAA